jgi:hypothetical protein
MDEHHVAGADRAAQRGACVCIARIRADAARDAARLEMRRHLDEPDPGRRGVRLLVDEVQHHDRES